VLFDTNIVLDVLLNREPWVGEAKLLWSAVDDERIIGCIAATTVTNIFYIARRAKGIEDAYSAIALCLDTFSICMVNGDILRRAMDGKTSLTADFEDAVQITCAVDAQVDAIVTRDKSGFQSSSILSLTPGEFLDRLG
jgi:predicted nucleic acid-binding protein